MFSMADFTGSNVDWQNNKTTKTENSVKVREKLRYWHFYFSHNHITV